MDMNILSANDASPTMEFGPFRLLPSSRMLLEGDKECRLGSRALEILIVLLERAGETVTKQELLTRAWPGTSVDEANLRVHIAALRKVLGDGQSGTRYIANVMGRGYCFVAPVRAGNQAVQIPASPPVGRHRSSHNLPALLTRVVGREDAVQAIVPQVPMRRCVTIVGPGGIGKTTVAIAAAERLPPVYDHGVWFIDLATVVDAQAIPFVLAAALEFSAPANDPVGGLIAFLRDKRLLLLLDNCEHIVDAVAPLAETILAGAPNVGILATSREALRIAGEWVFRLPPIQTPPETAILTAAEALRYPAVQLFVERASAVLDGFALTDADAAIVAGICRRLDGLALAIELVAARIDLFGLRGLATALNDQFLLLSEGQRTAQPRQQNLLATLEWSYRLLSPTEQTVLRRLSAFNGDFTIEAAIAVAGGDGITVSGGDGIKVSGGDGVTVDQVYAAILSLSMKSLIATDVTGKSTNHYHRLLHVTRAFVGHKLRESGENVDRVHAVYLCQLLSQAETHWQKMERAEWLEIYSRTIDDVRAALEWAFSARGDSAIGVALTAAALPVGFRLSLIDEVGGWVKRALLHVGGVPAFQPLAEMRLNVARGSLFRDAGGQVQGRSASLDRAIELARQLDSLAYQVEPLIGQAVAYIWAGDCLAAAEMADKAREVAVASQDPMATLAADRVSAQTYHLIGDHAAAQEIAVRLLDHGTPRLTLAYNPLAIDRRVSMRIIQARIAWITGYPAEAASIADEAISFAQSDSAFSLCQALILAAIPIAIWNGDDRAAGRLTETVIEQANRYTLAQWRSWGQAYQSLLSIRSEGGGSPPVLSGAFQFDTFATFSPDLLTPATSLRAEAGVVGWCRPEIFRAQGEWLLRRGAPGAAETAEVLFQRSLRVARTQGARSWELRAATSLASLWQRQGRSGEGRALLLGLLRGFTEGASTADLRSATELLALSEPGSSASEPAGNGQMIETTGRAGNESPRPRLRV